MTAWGVSEGEERKVTQTAFVLVPETVCEATCFRESSGGKTNRPRTLTQRLAECGGIVTGIICSCQACGLLAHQPGCSQLGRLALGEAAVG